MLKPFGRRRQRRWTAARRSRVPLQWRNQLWQSLEEGAGKRGSECVCVCVCVRACVRACVRVCVCDTPTIAFRHLPPNSARFSYPTEGALLISAQLSTDAVSALRKVWVLTTLRVSLSGTFLQTLPELVTPLKGHSLSPCSCPATRSAPSERFGY